jgi:hypothetical protein
LPFSAHGEEDMVAINKNSLRRSKRFYSFKGDFPQLYLYLSPFSAFKCPIYIQMFLFINEGEAIGKQN